MRVSIFGTGYVGLVTGTCLAEVGHDVVCLDVDHDKIMQLRQGRIPLHEPGLPALIATNVEAGRLDFTTDSARAIDHADVILIAVGTPPASDGNADLRHVMACASSIGRHLTRPVTVAIKSTVPVGTADRVRERIAAELRRRDLTLPVHVASNPEFLKEGAAVEDCMRPDRIVVGTESETARAALRTLYAPFNRNRDRMVAMDTRSAELTKYAANAMLATKISFMNEIAAIAEDVGADIEYVRRGIGPDPRIGWHFIYAGAGYGGSCFPKDVKALLHTAERCGRPARLIREVETVNERQKGRLFELIAAHYGGEARLRGKTFAVWGLAFKPDTDDMREATSIRLLEQLAGAGAAVRAFDPKAMPQARRAFDPKAMPQARRVFDDRSTLTFCESATDALIGADALVLVTEWKEFLSPDFLLLRSTLHDAVLFDGRNLYDPHEVEDAGLAYYGIGRGRSRKGMLAAPARAAASPRLPRLPASPAAGERPAFTSDTAPAGAASAHAERVRARGRISAIQKPR
ncbi:UDP-glucose dehydrogenase family protein [Luteimonas suaedae]|uniref:UDP-glucose dehydrogenase family protein n=1 Tax=Luteimonas suaedae TaxID=2605430 RepID=UPI0011EE050D|nr:UDP-glucose/GDP-mannose dehydrogenase family protein [Luteimonas suaedae]